MKNMRKALMLCGILAILAACGEEDSEDLVQEISLSQDAAEEDGGSSTAGKGNADSAKDGNGATETAEASTEDGAGVFAFSYEDSPLLIPGDAFDPSALPEYTSISTVESCALDGMDNVYNYGQFELTAFDAGEGEHIYSIYFLDPNITTSEGLSLGDSVDDMLSLYGGDYETDGDAYIYTRDNTILSVIVQDGTIVSIEYRLDLS